jgi:hypothetical protein
MLTGPLGALLVGLLLARGGRGGGWAAARVSGAAVGGLAGGSMLLSGAAGHWAADLSRSAPAGGAVLELAATCAGATLLLLALGLAARHPAAGVLTVAAALAACLAGIALLDAVAASWTGGPAAGVSAGALSAAARGAVLAGTGMLLLGAGLRALCAEHAQRWALAGRVLHGVAAPASHERIAAEASCEFAA